MASSATFVEGFLTSKPSYLTASMSGLTSKRALYEKMLPGESLLGVFVGIYHAVVK